MSSKSLCFCLSISLVFICSSCYCTVKTKCSSLGFSDSPGRFPFSGHCGMCWFWNALECPSVSRKPLWDITQFFKVQLHLSSKIPYPTTWIELNPSLPGFNLSASLSFGGREGTALNVCESSLQTLKCSTDGGATLPFLSLTDSSWRSKFLW